MGDKRLINSNESMTRIMHTDKHAPGRQVFQTIYHDDAALEQNKRIRLDGLMVRGQKLPIIDAPVSFAFSFPSVERRDAVAARHPDIFADIRSKDQYIRENAARKLSILHPEFCTLAEN